VAETQRRLCSTETQEEEGSGQDEEGGEVAVTDATIEKAYTVLVVVASVAVSVLVAAAAIWLVAALFGFDAAAVLDVLLSAAAGLVGGAAGYRTYKHRSGKVG